MKISESIFKFNNDEKDVIKSAIIDESKRIISSLSNVNIEPEIVILDERYENLILQTNKGVFKGLQKNFTSKTEFNKNITTNNMIYDVLTNCIETNFEYFINNNNIIVNDADKYNAPVGESNHTFKKNIEKYFAYIMNPSIVYRFDKKLIESCKEIDFKYNKYSSFYTKLDNGDLVDKTRMAKNVFLDTNIGCFGKNIIGMNYSFTLPDDLIYLTDVGTFDINRDSHNQININVRDNFFIKNSLVRLTITQRIVNNNTKSQYNNLDFTILLLLYVKEEISGNIGKFDYINHRVIYKYTSDNPNITPYIKTNDDRINIHGTSLSIDSGLYELYLDKSLNSSISQKNSYTFETFGSIIHVYNNNILEETVNVLNSSNVPVEKTKWDNLCKKIFGTDQDDQCIKYISAIRNRNILEILEILGHNITNINNNLLKATPGVQLELLTSLRWSVKTFTQPIKRQYHTVDEWLTFLQDKDDLVDQYKKYINENKSVEEFLNTLIEELNDNNDISSINLVKPKESGLTKYKKNELSSSDVKNLRETNLKMLYKLPFIPNPIYYNIPIGIVNPMNGGGVLKGGSLVKKFSKKCEDDLEKAVNFLKVNDQQLSNDTLSRLQKDIQHIKKLEESINNKLELLDQYIYLSSRGVLPKYSKINLEDINGLINTKLEEQKTQYDNITLKYNTKILSIDNKFQKLWNEIAKVRGNNKKSESLYHDSFITN